MQKIEVGMVPEWGMACLRVKSHKAAYADEMARMGCLNRKPPPEWGLRWGGKNTTEKNPACLG